MSQKLPEITLSDWLRAEAEVRASAVLSKITAQPKGSITRSQYAKLTNRSEQRASVVLKELFKAGKSIRERWYLPAGGFTYVYWLKK